MLPRRVVSALKRLVVWLVGLSLLAAGVGMIYVGTPLEPSDDATAEVRDDPDVVVESTDEGYVLRDADPAGERVGLVFYPGGRVAPRAYLWPLAPLVERTDVRVYVVEMPLNLAVVDPGAAEGVIGEHPEVDSWYVGGHSLGGAMACRFASNHPGRVDGVVLLGGYCVDDLRGTDLSVLTVTGSRDAVVNRDRLAGSRDLVPPDATFRELPGVNHSFGAYDGQPGDRPATVDERGARSALADVLVAWFGNVSSRSTAAAPASPRTGRPS